MRQPHYRLPNVETEIEERYLAFENIEGFSGRVVCQVHIDWDTETNTPLIEPQANFKVAFRNGEKTYEMSFWVKEGEAGHIYAKSTHGARRHYFEEDKFQTFAQTVYTYWKSAEGEADWKVQTIAAHEAKIAELQTEIDYRRSKIEQYK